MQLLTPLDLTRWNPRVVIAAWLSTHMIKFEESYTVFRQAFLLNQYSHNIRNILLTAGKQNSWLFHQHSFNFVCEKMENNSTLKKVLLVCNRNAELLRLVGATFDSKVAFLGRMRKKNLIILKSLQKNSAIFGFVCLSLLTFELSNINCSHWTYLWQCCIKIFRNIITICIFIEQ